MKVTGKAVQVNAGAGALTRRVPPANQHELI